MMVSIEGLACLVSGAAKAIQKPCKTLISLGQSALALSGTEPRRGGVQPSAAG